MYFGLMVKDNKPKVLEYNCRLGDPETQCLMMQLESDFLQILIDALDNKNLNLTWSKKSSMGVVIASGGYPEEYEKNQVIDLFELSDVKLFHAGTKYINDKLLTNGGRVFSLNAKADDLITCKKIIYSNIENIKFNNMIFRSDIGEVYES
jgi:phosphoribosylamine--glycine ligase